MRSSTSGNSPSVLACRSTNDGWGAGGGERVLLITRRLTDYGIFTIINPMTESVKPVSWIGSSYRDFRAFPAPVQDSMGFALYQAQTGGKSLKAKPLKGFGGAAVLEIVSDFAGDTFRAVYTVKFDATIYVLHAFQKKSKAGIKTTAADIDLIARRLRVAEADYRSQTRKGITHD